VLVLQGASYFRAIGADMVYGLSCRAVAIGTGGAGPEEFPAFRHLRLDPPVGGMARFEALIDSPSLAGHMDLRLLPGSDTVAEISVTLFPRRDIADIGVAPLTSMYLKGPLRAAVSDDFRPRVHDSDLLHIENGQGEHLWRPIANPALIQTSAFGDTGPRSFALYQTRRAFADYVDPEARYHDRPSAIVSPRATGGGGGRARRDPHGRRVHGQHRGLLAPRRAAPRGRRIPLRLPRDLDPRAGARRRHRPHPRDPERAGARPAGDASLRHRLRRRSGGAFGGHPRHGRGGGLGA
jgi:hypothetical protein